ncbi:MAG: hypothetical protein K9J82_03080 [Methylotenera sp.]|jgi:type IV pilus assembly protein PilX|nr:hypothetical protein [Methylotenera sp.]
MKDCGVIAHRRPTPAQRGVSLIFALMALVVISLGAVALVRSVDTSSLVIGNLGFKQDATSAAAQAAEQAIAYLNANVGTTLQSDQTAAGYYASSGDAIDMTGQSGDPNRALVNWTGASNCTGCIQPSAQISLNGGNNTARYIITRLCSAAGAPSTVDCAVPVGSALTGGGNKGVVGYGKEKIETMVPSSQYYRIVVRAQSARGTVSFTETIVRL